MADTKITALTAITTVDPAVDVLPIVDVSDTTMAASGTTKKITSNQILGAGGTATLASATISGALTAGTGSTTSPITSLFNDVSANTDFGSALTVKSNANPSVYLQRLVATRGSFADAMGWKLTTQSGGGTEMTAWTVGPTGINNWFISGSTAMTLNSTGLGVGVTPANDKVLVSQTIGLITSTTADLSFRNIVGTAIQRIRFTDGSGTLTVGSATATAYPVELGGDTVGRAVIIDGSKNVGVGVTPSAWNSAYKALQVGVGASIYGSTSGPQAVWIGANVFKNSSNQDAYIGSNFATQYVQFNGTHYWQTAASGTAGNAITFTQAMTLTASGDLLVGKTTSGVNTDGSQIFPGGACSFGHVSGTASATIYATFGLAGVQIGSITQNGTTGVLYNINSDYRLKESVAPLSNGLARVNALKPSIYKWKSDGSAGEGFIAHELAEVVPFAVTGEKDAVNEDGSIKSQGIDMSRIVPILVAAIKELTARVEALEA